MVGIYVIKSTKHYYVGLSGDLNKRKREHFYKLKCNEHQNQLLQNVYNKGYNLEFEVIQECEIEELNRLEILWIELYGIIFPNLKCLNLKSGGNRPTYSLESKEKMSKSKVKKDYDWEQRYLVIKENTEEILYVGTILEISKEYKITIDRIKNINKIGFGDYYINIIEALEEPLYYEEIDYMLEIF